jgi:hypothetical protein
MIVCRLNFHPKLRLEKYVPMTLDQLLFDWGGLAEPSHWGTARRLANERRSITPGMFAGDNSAGGVIFTLI